MTDLIPYRTCISTFYHKKGLFPPPYKGKNWYITFDRPKEEIGSSTIIEENGSKTKLSPGEIIINVNSFEKAWAVAELLQDCITVINPDIVSIKEEFSHYGFRDNPIIVVPKRKRDLKKLVKEINKEHPGEISEDYLEAMTKYSASMPGLVPACVLASKVSFRKSYHYAIMKLAFSMSHLNILTVDQSPETTTEIFPKIKSPKLQIKAAFSLIAAYSAIEELGLEIRASQKNPSRPEGKWNFNVKNELENRLKKSGVDIKETQIWMLRGGKTLLESGRPIKGKGTRWNYGKIRDEKVNIINALADSSWLRSHVASHRFQDLINEISPYDVINVQDVARRLILEKFGLLKKLHYC